MTAAALNRLTSLIIGAAIELHRVLGPGLLETTYVTCFAHDLLAAGLRVEVQRAVPLVYRGLSIPCAYKADLIVDDAVVIEVKAIDTVADVHRRQVHTYVRLANCRVGLLLNFGARTMKEGIIRVVNNFPE